MKLIVASMAVAVAALTLTATAASASTREIARSPYFRPVPTGWHAPHAWLRGAICVHEHESGDWHRRNYPYANGFQFVLSTWLRAGGSASTWASASPREQVYRAWIIWTADGDSWREWPNTSRTCGLR